MIKNLLVTAILISFSITGICQSKLTPKQISKRNYQEVIGDNSTDSIVPVPDKYAMYPDGMNGIHNHILRYLFYPQNALNRGVQGMVILRFVVEKDGTIEEIEVLQSVDPELDAEAIRVLKKLKPWVPGYKDGKPVRLEYKFPFNFKI